MALLQVWSADAGAYRDINSWANAPHAGVQGTQYLALAGGTTSTTTVTSANAVLAAVAVTTPGSSALVITDKNGVTLATIPASQAAGLPLPINVPAQGIIVKAGTNQPAITLFFSTSLT